ncbi:MAG: methyltransferase domain-containing protein [Planctomycetota bacterium]|jgi:SAM-dependent methyltransferase
MADLSSFWRGRASRHGHTGWGDQVLYAYDQLERLQIVTRLMPKIAAGAGHAVALDFGCGTGDFSRLLLDMGFEVYGYDPFVEPDIDHRKFTYVNDLDALTGMPPMDVALSVTVLDHILDTAELNETLSRVHGLLRSGGSLLLIEYALQQPRETSHYQAFRTISEWHDALERSAFHVVDSGPVPHPVDSPSDGFRVYRRKPIVRVLRRLNLAHRGLPRMALRRVARRSLAAHPPSVPHTSASPMRFMVCAA